MNYHQEITVIKSPDVSPYFIWTKLYTQVHLALVEHTKVTHGKEAVHGDIGVSFPEYHSFEKNGKNITVLGSKLRVFAKTQQALAQLNLNQWCERLLDYVHIKSIQPVPETSSYCMFSRARQHRNLDRIARRRAKHQNIPFEQAKANIINNYAEKNNVSQEQAVKDYANPKLQAYPYITLKSESGGHFFPLEIKKKAAQQPQSGLFNTYGLSSTTTVPDW